MTVPFVLIFVTFNIYADLTYTLNKGEFVSQCLDEVKFENKSIVVVEQETFTAFVKIRDNASGETVWCENDGSKLELF